MVLMVQVAAFLASDAENSESALESSGTALGGAIVPLLGVLLGATIGALVQRFMLTSARVDSLLESRKQEYFTAIDCVYRMGRSLRENATALSGRREADESSTDEERLDADERDRRSADALLRLIESWEDLRLEGVRLGAIGSVHVLERLEAVTGCVDDYMARQFGRDDNKWIASTYVETMETFDRCTKDFIDSVRDDLKTDTRVREKKLQGAVGTVPSVSPGQSVRVGDG